MRRGVVLLLLFLAAAASGTWLFFQGTLRISVTPPEAVPANPLPAPPVSIVAIPFGVSMEELKNLARTRLPEEISGANPVRESLFEGRGTYLVRRDGTPDVRLDGDRLVLSVPVSFRARLNGSATALGISVPVSLSADGAATAELSMKPSVSSDWQVRTQPRILLKWRRPPAATVLGIRVTFQNAAEEFLRSRIEEALPRIDAAINESLHLRERAEEAWTDLQEPRRLSVSPDLWLSVAPLSIALSPLDLKPERVLLDARLESRLSLGTRQPEKKPNLPLPAVSASDPGGASKGFSLQLPIFLGYDAVNLKLKEELSGRTLSAGESRSITIETISASANGNRLVFEVKILAVEGAGLFSTRRAGTVYIMGTPKWDRSGRSIRLDPVDYDEGTTRGLLRTAAWVARPVLLESLRQAAVFPLSGPMDEATKALGRFLDKREIAPGLTLRGSAGQVALESVAVTKEGLALRVLLEGNAGLEWIP